MNPSFQKLNILLGKTQVTLGTKQTSLALTDLLAVEDNFSIDYIPGFTAQNLAQGIFGQPQTVKGTSPIDIKISMPVVPSGDTTTCNISSLMRASGFAVSGPSTNQYTYTPTSDVTSSSDKTSWQDMSLWAYTGDKSVGNSLITKAHSVMFSAKISGELGKPCMCEFTGKGVADGTPAAGNYNDSGSITLLSKVTPAVIKSTTATIGSLDGLHILKFDVDVGNIVELVKSPSADSGYLRSIITNRASKWSATILQDGVSTKNPISIMDAQTLTDLDFVFGTAGSKIEIKSTGKCQITSCKQGNDAGLNTFETAGIFVDNDWEFLVGVA
jgi:hypothetical protein